MIRTTTFASFTLALSLLACRGGSNTVADDVVDPDAAADDDAPPNGGSVTVKQVQDPAMASGTQIELHGVVVTAIDVFGAKTGDIWVEDADGGEFSGVKVFGAPLDVVATLVAGDIVDITNAEKDEFACSGTICGGGVFDPGQSITEVKGGGGGDLVVTKTGTGALPAPVEVDAVAIDALATPELRDAEWEKYEGVLITLVNTRQTGAVGTFGGGAADQKKFDATGHIVVESVLSAFPAEAVAGTCYTSITGIGDYFFDYLLLPTASDKLVTGGNGCAAQTVTTVTAVQMGTVTGGVSLNDVFVTAVDNVGTSKGIWVADSLTAAPNNGVLVFLGGTLDAQFAPGVKVDVIGTVQEFDVGGAGAVGDKLTEISSASATFVADAVGLPVADATQTATVLADIGAPGEPYEGVLVKLTLLKVTNIDAGQGKVELTDNTGAKIIMDNDAFDFAAQVLNTCYATVTGVMSVQLTDNIRTLNPRSAGDLVAGAGCN